ncbi:hypothetical protein KC878_00565 [Candidatus Saccharibacteria bacterium]|nr:hypothetical protein [Candidatus Saccharibacteria bacterium]MCB9821459.1 hypothetical protein [Candidatus Nomurabacteria bacterium]
MFIDSIKRGGVWVPPEELDTPFSIPDPETFRDDLTSKDRYRLCVAANEVVKAAFTHSLLGGVTPEILADPRAVAVYRSLSDDLQPKEQVIPTKLPIAAEVDGLVIYGADYLRQIEGYAGIKIEFTDAEGGQRTARVHTDWAIVDNEPMSHGEYDRLLGQIVTEVIDDIDDISYELLDSAARFAALGRSAIQSRNVGIVLDDGYSTEVMVDSFFDPNAPKSELPDKFMHVIVVTRRGLEDSREFYRNLQIDAQPVPSDDSTITEILYVLPGSMVALRAPLAGRKSDFEFVGNDDPELVRIARLIDDLRQTQMITNLQAINPRPLVIDRRGSGIGIDYKLSASLKMLESLAGSGVKMVSLSPEKYAKILG